MQLDLDCEINLALDAQPWRPDILFDVLHCLHIATPDRGRGRSPATLGAGEGCLGRSNILSKHVPRKQNHDGNLSEEMYRTNDSLLTEELNVGKKWLNFSLQVLLRHFEHQEVLSNGLASQDILQEGTHIRSGVGLGFQSLLQQLVDEGADEHGLGRAWNIPT